MNRAGRWEGAEVIKTALSYESPRTLTSLNTATGSVKGSPGQNLIGLIKNQSGRFERCVPLWKMTASVEPVQHRVGE